MKKNKDLDVIGLIPAAGYATRISPIPCSKEIYPIDFSRSLSAPKVISSYLIERFSKADVQQTYFIIRKGKWDIPEYYGNGTEYNMNFAYIATNPTEGTPFTIDQAYSFVKNHYVALGFPDILFHPIDAFLKLVKKLKSTTADVVLGLFPAENPSKVDMVKLDKKGRIQDIIIKPEKTDLKYTWLISVWSPVFTEFLNTSIQNIQKSKMVSEPNTLHTKDRELYMGDVILEAISSGLKIETVTFTDGTYIDIGSREDLIKAMNINFKDSDESFI